METNTEQVEGQREDQEFVCLSVHQERVINHAAGSHGVSGIFVKYDTSSLMVTVSEQHMPLWQFLVRLCGIVGGIFSTTGKSGSNW